MRRVLHDWPDDLCVKILKNLGAAMDSQSYILINEVVLPNVNAHWHAAMQDISMGILLGGKERSKAQWLTRPKQFRLRKHGLRGRWLLRTNAPQEVLALEEVRKG